MLHRVDRMMREAWQTSGRSLGSSGVAPPSENDPLQIKLAKAACRRAQDAEKQLRQMREAQEAVDDAKAQVAAWQSGSQSLATTMPGSTKPPLPSATNFPT